MSVEATPTTPSRRTLLAALAGGLAATAAGVLGRPDRAMAGTGAVQLGADNEEFDTTRITNVSASNTQNDHGLVATGKFNGAGLIGIGGSLGGIGVLGESDDTNGVRGISTTNDEAAILGRSENDNTGVQGFSTFGGLTATPTSPAKTGVYGYAAQDGQARGVTGESTSGRGVNGIATTGVGVFGSATALAALGVQGTNTTGTGAQGSSTSGSGIAGLSSSGEGVSGFTNSTSNPAIAGRSGGNNTGVKGFSGVGAGPATPAKTGVYGFASQDAAARGVTGETTVGRGVNGIATTGIGGHFSAGANGTALQAVGRVLFSSSGLTAIPTGANNVTVNPGIDLANSTVILCTLESTQNLTLRRISKDAAANTFRVFINTAVTAGNTVRVAWFIIG